MTLKEKVPTPRIANDIKAQERKEESEPKGGCKDPPYSIEIEPTRSNEVIEDAGSEGEFKEK